MNAPIQRTASAGVCLLLGVVLGWSTTIHATADDARSPGGAASGELGRLELADKPVSLLGDRLRVRMPAGAKVEPRSRNIMAAPESREVETRVVLDAKQERMVLMVREMFALAGDDFEKAVRAEVARSWDKLAATLRLEKLTVSKPLSAIAAVPASIDGKREANFMLGLYVRGGDGTVQLLTFHVNPAGAQDAAGAAALARKAALSLRPGARSLLAKAGECRFGAGEDRFVVTVPDGVVLSATEGPDFTVHRLQKLMPFGQTASEIGIYLGGHPSYLHQQHEVSSDKVKCLNGRLLGQAAEWRTWSETGEVTAEAIVTHPKDTHTAFTYSAAPGTKRN